MDSGDPHFKLCYITTEKTFFRNRGFTILGWSQRAGYASSSHDIQSLTSLDVLYTSSWGLPSPSGSQPLLKHRTQADADPLWQFSMFCSSPVLIKFPILWAAVEPCSWKSTNCSTCLELLQNTPVVAYAHRKDPTEWLCWAHQGYWCSQQPPALLSHLTRRVSNVSVKSSRCGPELEAKGLHNGLLSLCANTRHHPSCSVQSERINSSYPSKEETSVLLTSGCQCT